MVKRRNRLSHEQRRAAKHSPGRCSGRKQAAVPLARRRKRLTVIGAGGLAVIIALGLILVPRLGGGGTSAIAIAPDPTANIQTKGQTMGDPNAPVKVVEWANYQCPYCDQFWTTFEPTLIQNDISTGKVYFEYKDLTFGWQESIDASEAAVCADNQGKFWQYHDTLFKNQQAENSGGFSRSRLKQMAEQIGLDMTQFNQCFDGHQPADQVKAADSEAANLGITSTPTFYVNGQAVNYTGVGSVQAAIDAALGK